MSRDDPQMKIRLPASLKANIEQASSANKRTMNAEIVARLQDSFSGSMTVGTRHTRSTEAEFPYALDRVVQELESLQNLSALTYQLQKVTRHADSISSEVNAAWQQLQEAINSGTEEMQKLAKKHHGNLQEVLVHDQREIEMLEREISKIHFLRKASNMKELRDVQPVSAYASSSFSDAKPPQSAISKKNE